MQKAGCTARAQRAGLAAPAVSAPARSSACLRQPRRGRGSSSVLARVAAGTAQGAVGGGAVWCWRWGMRWRMRATSSGAGVCVCVQARRPPFAAPRQPSASKTAPQPAISQTTAISHQPTPVRRPCPRGVCAHADGGGPAGVWNGPRGAGRDAQAPQGLPLVRVPNPARVAVRLPVACVCCVPALAAPHSLNPLPLRPQVRDHAHPHARAVRRG